MSKAKRKPRPKIPKVCNPDTCDNCEYIGEGDSVCTVTHNIVLADWVPTDDFLRDCPYHQRSKADK